MEASPSPVRYADLAEARTAYGRGTALWASAGRLRIADGWWIALSRTRFVDYNLALIHGKGVGEAVSDVLGEVTRADVPAMVMLAGDGLGAADALNEAGWVCTGALPFMARDGGPAADDPCARLLGPNDLAAARRLAAVAFGVPGEVGAIVYAEGALERPGTRFWGLFEDGSLRSCVANQYVGDRFSVGWALSTAPGDQRSGYGRRLVRASAARRLAEGASVALLMATGAGQHLYEQEGYVTLEHWQLWSRPRWVLR